MTCALSLSVSLCLCLSVSCSPFWDWRPTSAFTKYHGCPKLVLFGILFLFCTPFLGYLYTSFELSWLYIDVSRNVCETHPVYRLSAWYSFFLYFEGISNTNYSRPRWSVQLLASSGGLLATGPHFTTFLLPGVYEACLFSLSLLLPAHAMPSITLVSLDNCRSYLTDLFYLLLWQHCLWKTKNTCIRLELPLLSDAVLNVDYKVWSFFPGVGHWQVTAFFCSLPSCPCSGDGACSLLHGPVQCSFLIFQQRHYLLLSCLSYLRTSILSSGSQPCYHGDYHETYHTHFLFFTVLYICVTSFLIL